MTNNNTTTETKITYTKIATGEYLATFTLKGISEQVAIKKVGNAHWKTDGSFMTESGFDALGAVKGYLAYHVALAVAL